MSITGLREDQSHLFNRGEGRQKVSLQVPFGIPGPTVHFRDTIAASLVCDVLVVMIVSHSSPVFLYSFRIRQRDSISLGCAVLSSCVLYLLIDLGAIAWTVSRSTER